MPSFLLFKRLYQDRSHSRHEESPLPPPSSLSTSHLSPNSSSASHLPSNLPSTISPNGSTRHPPSPPTANKCPTYDFLPKKYILLEKIGEGAFSAVFKAFDTTTRTHVAVKVLSKLSLSPKQLSNIRNEVAIMRHLPSHPNIVPLLDLIDSRDQCFIVVPFYDGGEIFNKIIEYTYFSEPLLRHVFCQLLLAIAHCHHNNVVHRDIKPENLLFKKIPFIENTHATLRRSDDPSKRDEGKYIPGTGAGEVGQIMLADFGLAKKFSSGPTSHHLLKTPCGTAGYTAPEVITVNQPKAMPKYAYSKAVDIWLLGCFLYTILCGFPPFYDENPEVVASKIVKGDYHFISPWWDEVSDGAKDLVSKMLVTDPNGRITIDEIWHHPWILENNGVDVSLDSAYFDAQKTKSRNPSVIKPIPSPSLSDNVPAPPSITPWQPELHIRFQPALMSPRADAIRRVFDTMADPRLGEQFIENIDEYYQGRSSMHSGKHTRLPRTPDPQVLLHHMGNNWQDNLLAESDELWDELGLSDDSDGDAERVDTITNLVSDVLRKLLIKHLAPEDEQSLRLLSNDSDEGADYRTRSLLVISGMNGEYKFTLNLGDSNLLSRRRLSTKGNVSAAPSVAPVVSSS